MKNINPHLTLANIQLTSMSSGHNHSLAINYYCIVLYYIVLYCIALLCIALYCGIFYFIVACNMCDMWHVKHVTCNIFNMTIELYFAWASQKYMTHWVLGKIVCNLRFVTCNMCDMLHVKHVTCNIFIITIELYFAWAFQKYMIH